MKRFLTLAFVLALALSAFGQTGNGGYPSSNTVPAFASDTGTSTAYVVTLLPCPVTLLTGFEVKFLPANANTGTTPTLNVCGLGAKTITKFGQSAVAINDLITTAQASVLYDGTDWELQNPNTAASTISGKAPVGTDAGLATAATISTTALNSVCSTANGGVSTTNCPGPVPYALDTGSGGNVVITVQGLPTSITTGACVIFKSASAGNATSTINVTPYTGATAYGAINLYKRTTAGVAAFSAAGDMASGDVYEACYDGTQWELMATSGAVYTGGPLGNQSVITGSSNNQVQANAGVTIASNLFTKYNNIALVNNGVPSELGTVDSSNSAAITATTLYMPAATGRFRISASLIVTTPATTSSILGGTTGVVITYTDGTSSVAQSVTCYAVNQSAAIITIGTGNTGNTTTSQYNCIPMYIYAKTGVAIQYAIGYTSAGGTAMVYEAHLLAESM